MTTRGHPTLSSAASFFVRKPVAAATRRWILTAGLRSSRNCVDAFHLLCGDAGAISPRGPAQKTRGGFNATDFWPGGTSGGRVVGHELQPRMFRC